MELNQLNNTSNEEALFELLTLNCEIDSYGNKFYKNKDGKDHRIHGPAIIAEDGSKIWCKNGLWHREDGPAYMHVNGYEEYWIDEVELTKDEFIQWQKDNGIKPIE